MRSFEKLARSNPLAVIGIAALGGWLIGSGIFALPFALPSLGHPTSPTQPAAPASLPASGSASATLATKSATMPATGPTDPLASWNL
jgi:hypothetical protein